MSVIDIMPLIRKYELGEAMTGDESQLLTAGLYFFYRAYQQMKKSPQGKEYLELAHEDDAIGRQA